MTTTTARRGRTIEIAGTAYTLADRAPVPGTWWAEAPTGRITMVHPGTAKRQPTTMDDLTREAEQRQRLAANLLDAGLYRSTFDGDPDAYPHQLAPTAHMNGCEKITTAPAENPAPRHSLSRAARDIAHQGHTVAGPIICRCVIDFDRTARPAPAAAPAPEPAPEPAAAGGSLPELFAEWNTARTAGDTAGELAAAAALSAHLGPDALTIAAAWATDFLG